MLHNTNIIISSIHCLLCGIKAHMCKYAIQHNFNCVCYCMIQSQCCSTKKNLFLEYLHELNHSITTLLFFVGSHQVMNNCVHHNVLSLKYYFFVFVGVYIYDPIVHPVQFIIIYCNIVLKALYCWISGSAFITDFFFQAHQLGLIYPQAQLIIVGWYANNWWVGTEEEQEELMDKYNGCTAEQRERVLSNTIAMRKAGRTFTDPSAVADSGIVSAAKNKLIKMFKIQFCRMEVR